MAAILSLADELHEAIATHLPLEDLLNFSCTNHRLHKMIRESTDVWSNLYSHIFGPVLGRLDADDTDPRAAFVKRCITTLGGEYVTPARHASQLLKSPTDPRL